MKLFMFKDLKLFFKSLLIVVSNHCLLPNTLFGLNHIFSVLKKEKGFSLYY